MRFSAGNNAECTLFIFVNTLRQHNIKKSAPVDLFPSSMKLAINALLLLCLVLVAFAADQPLRDVIVSYPKNAPSSLIEDAKNAIKEAGGIITHEYHLIKGFAAKAPAKILENVQAMGAEHNVLIEQDQTISINGA